jgi:hypothetical protein
MYYQGSTRGKAVYCENIKTQCPSKDDRELRKKTGPGGSGVLAGEWPIISCPSRIILIRYLACMITKFWQILKDDTTRTFEVCGQVSNDNHFSNRTIAMQRAGMNVSCMIPPVTHKNASRAAVKVDGYSREDGLEERLLRTYREIAAASQQESEYDSEPD